MSIIFQKSLDEVELPKDWIRTNVSPIFKKCSRNEPLNYRPVSLTSVPCKVLERLVKKRIIEHLEQNKLITQHQHGFRTKMSCLTRILEYRVFSMTSRFSRNRPRPPCRGTTAACISTVAIGLGVVVDLLVRFARILWTIVRFCAVY